MGARFSVLILKGAQKDLLGLSPAIRLQILAKMKSLETGPLPTGKSDVKILHGFRPVLFRLRSGDFRVVYRLKEKVVEVVAVVNRKELETMLRRLR